MMVRNQHTKYFVDIRINSYDTSGMANHSLPTSGELDILAALWRLGPSTVRELYEVATPKEQTQRQIAGDLLKRAFEGSAKSLVLGALSAQPASAADLADIRRMLDQFEKRRGSK